MITDQWDGLVSSEFLFLMERWVEYWICQPYKSGWTLPVEGKKYLMEKHYLNNKAKYQMVILTGLVLSRGTKPREFNRLDVFTHNVFSKLTNNEQTVVLSHIDPFEEFQDKNVWERFLREQGFLNKRDYERELEQSMVKLEQQARKVGLITGRRMDDKEYWTWTAISQRMNMDTRTLRRLAEKSGFPIAWVGGVVFSKESWITDWMNSRLECTPYTERA